MYYYFLLIYNIQFWGIPWYRQKHTLPGYLKIGRLQTLPSPSSLGPGRSNHHVVMAYVLVSSPLPRRCKFTEVWTFEPCDTRAWIFKDWMPTGCHLELNELNVSPTGCHLKIWAISADCWCTQTRTSSWKQIWIKKDVYCTLTIGWILTIANISGVVWTLTPQWCGGLVLDEHPEVGYLNAAWELSTEEWLCQNPTWMVQLADVYPPMAIVDLDRDTPTEAWLFVAWLDLEVS